MSAAAPIGVRLIHLDTCSIALTEDGQALLVTDMFDGRGSPTRDHEQAVVCLATREGAPLKIDRRPYRRSSLH